VGGVWGVLKGGRDSPTRSQKAKPAQTQIQTQIHVHIHIQIQIQTPAQWKRVKINNADVNFAYANTQCKNRGGGGEWGGDRGAARANRMPKAKCKMQTDWNWLKCNSNNAELSANVEKQQLFVMKQHRSLSTLILWRIIVSTIIISLHSCTFGLQANALQPTCRMSDIYMFIASQMKVFLLVSQYIEILF